jgi:hypothetical protein
MFVVELFFGLFREPGLRLFRMDLRAEAFFLSSSWVASHRCSLKLTNDGRQCWGSIARGYRTPTGKYDGTRTRKGE